MEGRAGQLDAVQQFYVATTLVDLLAALQTNGTFGCAVICSSRDTLDDIVGLLLRIQCTAVCCLHSDLSDEARSAVLQMYAKGLHDALHSQPTEETAEASRSMATTISDQGNDGNSNGAEDKKETAADGSASVYKQQERAKAHVLVSTDVGLRVAESTGLPADLALIVHFDLPTRKELYMKRMCLFARKSPLRVAVFFVTAGEVGAFRTVEGFSAGSIDVMPVHISDIFPLTCRG